MSRLIYDARESSGVVKAESIEPELTWEDLEVAAKAREHIKRMRDKEAEDASASGL